MNKESRARTLRFAVCDWQKRHGLPDHDPLLAVVELFELFLGTIEAEASSASNLEGLRKAVNELIQRIEKMGTATPPCEESTESVWIGLLIVTGIFAAGVVLGRALA